MCVYVCMYCVYVCGNIIIRTSGDQGYQEARQKQGQNVHTHCTHTCMHTYIKHITRAQPRTVTKNIKKRASARPKCAMRCSTANRLRPSNHRSTDRSKSRAKNTHPKIHRTHKMGMKYTAIWTRKFSRGGRRKKGIPGRVPLWRSTRKVKRNQSPRRTC